MLPKNRIAFADKSFVPFHFHFHYHSVLLVRGYHWSYSCRKKATSSAEILPADQRVQPCITIWIRLMPAALPSFANRFNNPNISSCPITPCCDFPSCTISFHFMKNFLSLSFTSLKSQIRILSSSSSRLVKSSSESSPALSSPTSLKMSTEWKYCLRCFSYFLTNLPKMVMRISLILS
jgi:hypothetical protein